MTTFVTSIFYLSNSNPNDNRKSIENRLKYFEEIVNYGIKISIVCCPYYEKILKPLLDKYDNIKIIEVMNLSDTIIYKICKEYERKYEKLKLPLVRDNDKDDDEYLILMNSKIEFVKKAIDINIWNSNYFCWIDFSIKYMIKNEDIFKNYINKLKCYEMSLNHELNIIIPGCEEKAEIITWHPIWRYSGSIFYGHKDGLVQFYNINNEYFYKFLETYSLLTWEITVWAWFEYINVFNPVWVHGRHNESIISFVNN